LKEPHEVIGSQAQEEGWSRKVSSLYFSPARGTGLIMEDILLSSTFKNTLTPETISSNLDNRVKVFYYSIFMTAVNFFPLRKSSDLAVEVYKISTLNISYSIKA